MLDKGRKMLDIRRNKLVRFKSYFLLLTTKA